MKDRYQENLDTSTTTKTCLMLPLINITLLCILMAVEMAVERLATKT